MTTLTCALLPLLPPNVPGLASCSPRLVGRGRDHINAPQSAVLVDRGADRKQLRAGNMTSSVWGLLGFIGILVSGTLGTFPQFGSHDRQIHSIRPLSASPQVPPRVNQRFGDIKSIEQTSDEEPSSESFQEVQLGDYGVRGFQQPQQGARPGASSYQNQGRRRTEDGGWLVGVCGLME